MRLHFLGRGAAFNTREGNTAACVRADGQLLLLDCGETVFARLREGGLLEGVTRVLAAVSHLHADHCGSLGTLALYCRYVLHTRLEIIVPEDEAYVEQLRALLAIVGCGGDDYTLTSDTAFAGAAGVSALSCLPTRHAPGMRCFSFALKDNEGWVFYSADTCTADTALDFLAAHPDARALYMDATDADFPGNVHLSLARLEEAFPPALRKRVFLMHLNAPGCAEKGRALGFGIADM